MMIETIIVICYGNGCAGMEGFIFNENALILWVQSPHISSMMENNFLDLNQSAITCSKLTIETLEQGGKYVQS